MSTVKYTGRFERVLDNESIQLTNNFRPLEVQLSEVVPNVFVAIP